MTQIVTLFLPWVDAEDKWQHQVMRLSGDTIGKRVARRIMRKWYKNLIGITVDKRTLEAIWKRRHVSKALSATDINLKFQEMAIASYNECPAPSASEEASGDAEVPVCPVRHGPIPEST